ncbi:MAG: tetratricopeptide repeat protein [Cyclobacteriaceae bacterium]|nr:tetratricopeptide repeat protein [Cyclobacteriaceae bacterium]
MNLLKPSVILIFSITSSNLAISQHLKLTTSSDSAIYYYYEGWRQVMDVGNYTASEVAYRKMMSFDKGFLVGLSLLGRITGDLNERQEIERTLENRKGELNGDERLLLDNYIALVKLTNLRETDPEGAKVQLEKAFASGEENLNVIVHRYPDEIYYKAEYIEVLHRNYGSQRALDSLYNLATPQQQNEPFLLGYAANMEAEAGNFENALDKAALLSKQIRNRKSPKPHIVYSDIYFKMGKFDKAKKYVQSALKLDPGNIDAQRLEKKISDQLIK